MGDDIETGEFVAKLDIKKEMFLYFLKEEGGYLSLFKTGKEGGNLTLVSETTIKKEPHYLYYIRASEDGYICVYRRLPLSKFEMAELRKQRKELEMEKQAAKPSFKRLAIFNDEKEEIVKHYEGVPRDLSLLDEKNFILTEEEAKELERRGLAAEQGEEE